MLEHISLLMPGWISHIDLYTTIAAGSNVALAVLGVIVSVYEKWSKKHRTAIWVGFGALACIGVFATVAAAAKSARDLQDTQTHLQNAQDESRKEILAAMNGGDSFCYAIIDPFQPPKRGKINLTVVHQGKYALHDVTLVFFDWDRLIRMGMAAIADHSKHYDQQRELATATRKMKLEPLMPTHYLQVALDYEPLQAKSHKYQISFDGPNGQWDEVLLLRLVHDKWVSAFRVSRETPSADGSSRKRELVESVDQEFPQPVDWD